MIATIVFDIRFRQIESIVVKMRIRASSSFAKNENALLVKLIEL